MIIASTSLPVSDAEANARRHLARIVALQRCGDINPDQLADYRARRDYTIPDDEGNAPLTADERAQLDLWEASLSEAEIDAGDPFAVPDGVTQALDDYPLEVLVRSGWTSPGEPLEPREINILLTFGGPGCRVVRREYGEVSIEHCHWGDPWTAVASLTSEQAEALDRFADYYLDGLT